jgi:hypothetical protein
MKDFINSMPKLQHFAPSNSKNSVCYHIREILANILINKNTLQNMVFCSNKGHEFVDEIYKSSGWTRFFSHERVASDELPIVLLLFYDDMAKYRFAPAKMGGLYMAILNTHRDLLSQLDNIFCVGLIHDETNFDGIIDELVTELEELYQPHLAHTVHGKIKIRTMLGLFLADTPQRNEICHMKKPNAFCQCIHCLGNKDSASAKPVSHGGPQVLRRSAPKMRELWNEWRNKPNAESKKQFAKENGLKPPKNGQLETPMYRLYDLYGFDIHEQMPVEFLHVAIIGLFADHVELLFESLSASKRRKFEQIHATCKLNNRELRPFSSRGYWMGEEWLEFLAVAPFLMSKMLNDEQDDVISRRIKAFILHCKWLQIMLQRSLSIPQINRAEDICVEWRAEMVLLYPQSNLVLHKANFHNILHVFPFAREWGPPILYWCRQFEQKHKVFRQFVKEGNHHNDEVWAANRHNILLSLYWVYENRNTHHVSG